MADALIAFLCARLDEDEEVARATVWDGGGDRLHWQVVASGTRDAIFLGDRTIKEHIARHDPVRVLADVAAKRQVVDRYERAMANRRAHPDDLATAGALLALRGVVQLLASPYVDHPDFDAAWAVDTPQ